MAIEQSATPVERVILLRIPDTLNADQVVEDVLTEIGRTSKWRALNDAGCTIESYFTGTRTIFDELRDTQASRRALQSQLDAAEAELATRIDQFTAQRHELHVLKEKIEESNIDGLEAALTSTQEELSAALDRIRAMAESHAVLQKRASEQADAIVQINARSLGQRAEWDAVREQMRGDLNRLMDALHTVTGLVAR